MAANRLPGEALAQWPVSLDAAVGAGASVVASEFSDMSVLSDILASFAGNPAKVFRQSAVRQVWPYCQQSDEPW